LQFPKDVDDFAQMVSSRNTPEGTYSFGK